MPRSLILGTAGHIDHGKTALVRALTGIDCDRLPEEKKRGITIDLGFAHLDLGPFHLGIVDVPGHERFIRNMLAGSTGIDLALLVVSAGESVKPQTREHVEILELLGLSRGVVALTKCDLVDETTRDVVALEVHDLVKGSFLEAAPLIQTSVVTGEGIDELKAALFDACENLRERNEPEWFRLAIDRVFVVQGHGTVVTGSVASGSVRVGDELEWQTSGTRVRIRGLQQHDHAVDQVQRGQRAALNLAGVPHEEVRRGQELATPGYLIPSCVLTVRVRALAENPRPLRHRMAVRLHLGTAEIMGTISLLESDRLAPGAAGLAQLFLDESAVAVCGQPFVLRDSAAERTLGGGRVLQPLARKIRRRHREVLEWVERLEAAEAPTPAEAAAWFAEWHGAGIADIVRGTELGPEAAKSVLDALIDDGKLIEMNLTSGRRPLHVARVEELEMALLEELQRCHQACPMQTSLDRQQVLSVFGYVDDPILMDSIVERLLTAHRILGGARRIAHANFQPKLSAAQRTCKERLIEAIRVRGMQPPEPLTVIGSERRLVAMLPELLALAVAEGELVHIGDSLYLHHEAEEEIQLRVRQRLEEQPAGLTVADLRDLLGTTRKFAFPLSEYLDRIGLTQREGDRHTRR